MERFTTGSMNITGCHQNLAKATTDTDAINSQAIQRLPTQESAASPHDSPDSRSGTQAIYAVGARYLDSEG